MALTFSSGAWSGGGGAGGSGDMTAATYDPTAKATDAFNLDNIADGATKKGYTATEKTKLAAVYTPGTNDVALADGGTGASTAAAARTNLGVTKTLPEIYQDFTSKSNGATPVTVDSGQARTVVATRSGATPTVSSGRLVDPDTAAGTTYSYHEVTAAATLTYLSFEFDLGATGSTDAGGAGLHAMANALPQSGGILTSPAPDVTCHIACFKTYYEMGVFVSTAFISLGIVGYGPTFANSDIQCVEAVIDKDRSMVYVRGADGKITPFSHSIIGSTSVTSLCTQVGSGTSGATDHRGQILRFEGDSTPLRNTTLPLYWRARDLFLAGQEALRRPKVLLIASAAAPAINVNTTDQVSILSQGPNITSMSTGLTGSPMDGQELVIRITDDGTGCTIAWGASWRAMGVTLPTTLAAGKTTYVTGRYNASAVIWDAIGVQTQP